MAPMRRSVFSDLYRYTPTGTQPVHALGGCPFANCGLIRGFGVDSLRRHYFLFLVWRGGVGTHKGETRQRGWPTSEFTAAGPAREARSQKLSCGQNERKRSSDRTPSDLARDECSSRRVSFGVRSSLSARRRSDCKRRFVFWACALVGGFAAGFGFWFSFLRARFFDDSRCLDVIVLGLPKGTRGTA